MFKKISAILLALTLTAASFTSCAGNNDSSSSGASSQSGASDQSAADVSAADDSGDSAVPAEPSLTIDGEKVDTDGLVMCTIDGIDVDFDTFRYYYYYVLNLYYQNYGATIDDVRSTDGGFDMLLTDTVFQIKQEFVTYHLAEENGIELTDEDEKNVDDLIQQSKDSVSTEEQYLTQLKSSYLTEDLYRKMLELSTLYNKIESTLLTNEGKYATKKDDFKKIVQDKEQYSRVVHILIPYECQAEITDEDTLDSYDSMSLSDKLTAKKTAFNALSEEDQEKCRDEAKKLAEEVKEKADSGEDFSELIKEYGWDPGMEQSPEGYYVNQDTSFVEEFKKAAFELDENEVSDLVESESYGWFIIKRLPVDMDYVEENIDSMISEYDYPKITGLYTGIIDEMDVQYSDYFDKLTIDSIT